MKYDIYLTVESERIEEFFMIFKSTVYFRRLKHGQKERLWSYKIILMSQNSK